MLNEPIPSGLRPAMTSAMRPSMSQPFMSGGGSVAEPPSGLWILTSGVWSDAGEWDDVDTWNDGA
jgi:hypothetical protein